MLLFTVVALIAGVFNAVEPGQNASLSKALGQPWIAALVLVAVNAVIFLVVGAFTGGLAIPSMDHIEKVPWWAWLGGLTSAFIVASQLFVSEEMGATRFVACVVTAGVATSVLLDNYALVGFDKHAANLGRIAGAILMVLGVALVSVF